MPLFRLTIFTLKLFSGYNEKNKMIKSISSLHMEFHVSRYSRDYYGFDQSLFSFNGSVIFANFHAARTFAKKMNDKRDLISYPESAVRAGQINAMGLIDEIMHFIVEAYRLQRNPEVMRQALAWLEENFSREQIEHLLHQFIDEFPPLSVYRGELTVDDYLASESVTPNGERISNRQIALEELLMLWITNRNPATTPYLELFDDSNLDRDPLYAQVMNSLHEFFDTQPPFGPDYQNLIDMLRAPAIAVPHSLSGQLEFIRSRWGYLLGKYLYRLLSSLDLIKEEEKAIFGVGGGGPSYVYEFSHLDEEIERFSQDRDWMPNLVLIAKNIYVWLDQLSKQFERPITRLDQIPDEELEKLARWGFSGLWLIGVWERSIASRTIKQLRGNPEAVASAYSLFSYDIAEDLGGEEAYHQLRQRAWAYGIRLASDMVPNHMGIDSRWVIEHPDWFISLDYSPFPSYSFNGPNLSWDERVGIFIEDHYYDNSDAAVVFKRVDFWTGSEKYIYHGNDGTSMPWNDTAQLNYLLPEVREAVIQTILEVARKFPVIRFDAAMTLAKKHYQRLWFPEPGCGGDIPSRSEYGMTKAEFDKAFPKEFWREVVDRVAQEVPDTLLLAEAFWLMEGYFVRTLGMHRVYNSAFMNMLRDEKNQEYRLVIKNTLEFDPEILKRYVNFMNNPDERTAVDQFGKGDKYFGICTLMATLPGLPMFGHGQIEGYTEKYGMEYRVAYWDENPDPYLVERHQREIFPLLRKRWLFAEVENFLLYDFYSVDGYVDEDVFAYSNRTGEHSSLVVYHNQYAETRGRIHTSAAYLDKSGTERKLVQKTLGKGLALSQDANAYVIFREHNSGLEYIRSCREVHQSGMYVELHAYQTQVFLDFHQVWDDEKHMYKQLAEYLDGRGVPSIDEAFNELYLRPLHTAFRELINPGMMRWLIDNRSMLTNTQESQPAVLAESESKLQNLLRAVAELTSANGDISQLASGINAQIEAALNLPTLLTNEASSDAQAYQSAIKYLDDGSEGEHALLEGNPITWSTLFSYLVVKDLGKVLSSETGKLEAHISETIAGKSYDGSTEGTSAPTVQPGLNPDDERLTLKASYSDLSRAWIDEWMLGRIIAETLQEMGASEADAWRQVGLIKLLISHHHVAASEAPLPAVSPPHASANEARQPAVPSQASPPYAMLLSWLRDSELTAFLGVNRYQDVLWFNKEAFQEWVWWVFLAQVVDINTKSSDIQEIRSEISASYKIVNKLLQAEASSDYQVERLLEGVRE